MSLSRIEMQAMDAIVAASKSLDRIATALERIADATTDAPVTTEEER